MYIIVAVTYIQDLVCLSAHSLFGQRTHHVETFFQDDHWAMAMDMNMLYMAYGQE